MISLLIKLTEDMANASKIAAKRLGISRTQFIRNAILHEVARVERKHLLHGMIKDFQAMKKDSTYQEFSKELDEGLDDDLLPDEGKWWEEK